MTCCTLAMGLQLCQSYHRDRQPAPPVVVIGCFFFCFFFRIELLLAASACYAVLCFVMNSHESISIWLPEALRWYALKHSKHSHDTAVHYECATTYENKAIICGRDTFRLSVQFIQLSLSFSLSHAPFVR